MVRAEAVLLYDISLIKKLLICHKYNLFIDTTFFSVASFVHVKSFKRHL